MYEAAIKRHVQSFVHMVTDGGKSYTAAWEVIKARTTFGEVLRAELWGRCLTAATEAKRA